MFFRIARRFRGLIAAYLATGWSATLFATLSVLYFQRLIDALSGGAASMESALPQLALYAATSGACLIANYVDELPSNRLRLGIEQYIRQSMLRKVAVIDYTSYQSYGTGQLVKLVENGAAAGRDIVFEFALRIAAFLAPSALLSLAFMGAYSPGIMLVALSGYVVVFVVTRLLLKRLHAIKERTLVSEEWLSKAYVRALMELIVLRVNRRFRREIERIEGAAEELVRSHTRIRLTHEFFFAAFALLVLAIKVAMVVACVPRLARGDLSVGVLLALLTLTDRIYEPIAIFNVIYVDYKLNRVAWERLERFDALPNDPNVRGEEGIADRGGRRGRREHADEADRAKRSDRLNHEHDANRTDRPVDADRPDGRLGAREADGAGDRERDACSPCDVCASSECETCDARTRRKASWHRRVGCDRAARAWRSGRSARSQMASPALETYQPGAAAIEMRGVCLDYGGAPVLRDLSLDIEPGRTTAIVGRSGAGKSTIAKLLLGLIKPTSGAIRVDGQDLAALDLLGYYRHVAYISQDAPILDGTLRENVAFDADVSDAALMEALDRACLGDFVRALPEGLEAQVGERGVKLSGGEKQRLALARVLLQDPLLLVLDEPTSALDVQTERDVVAALHEALRGRTVVSIAHRLSTIRDADAIVVLEDGAAVERGTHAELMARGGAYARLVAMDRAGEEA